MIRAASIGFSPGIDPTPVADPGTHGNARFSATVSSLAARPARGLSELLTQKTELPGGSPGARSFWKARGLAAGPARRPPVVVIARRLLPPVAAAVRVPAAVAAVQEHAAEQGKRDDQQHAHGDPDDEEDADDDRYDLEASHRSTSCSCDSSPSFLPGWPDARSLRGRRLCRYPSSSRV